MGDGVPKGTVTALSSIFPVEESQKAAKRVEDAISERQKQVGHLQRFITDNTNLINLVQKLPDDLSHPIMVPFGKAAFFPGRLIHTNEFLVLLGDGYYAERTSKQTTEILQRRGKALESQIESLKAMMQDLQAEASFFNATAAEAAEGLVEIREEYIEEHPAERKNQAGLPKPNSIDSSEPDGAKVIAEDEEYARIMSRFDELEREEQEASRSDEDEDAEFDTGFCENQLNDSIEKLMNQQLSTTTKKPLSGNDSGPDQSVHTSINKPKAFQVEDLKGHFVAKDESRPGKTSASNMEKFGTTEKPIVLPRSEEKVCAIPAPKIKDPGDNVMGQTSKSSADRRKAFTGSIVEHSHGIPSNPPSNSLPSSSQEPSSKPSKPVSRFKMQKGNR
ncbi:uncharacterized protein LOC131239350 isoform X3 [Magnolia sinica]|uniref:uncharacterized protein LOC131239350 isoform X3 n=1 Tax=Magnolia sinica TaxID=86752 RepID=UPI00265AE7BB|nr:uncharacterized protein LOC131239350 isoform X3 [Magnolia sinica]